MKGKAKLPTHPNGKGRARLGTVKRKGDSLICILKDVSNRYKELYRTFKPNKKFDEMHLERIGCMHEDWEQVYENLLEMQDQVFDIWVADSAKSNFKNITKITKVTVDESGDSILTA
jgi:hypothetical protein